jgi:hypothetical protein
MNLQIQLDTVQEQVESDDNDRPEEPPSPKVNDELEEELLEV